MIITTVAAYRSPFKVDEVFRLEQNSAGLTRIRASFFRIRLITEECRQVSLDGIGISGGF